MLKELKDILNQGNYSCVIAHKEVRTFTRPGVADLYNLIHTDRDFLKGASMADKIVGKAAATLMVVGKIKELYTPKISSSALNLLEKNRVTVVCEDEVPFIQNRDKTDWCPLERICFKEENLEKIEILIGEFINRMSQKK